MDPPQHHQLLFITVVKQLFLVQRLARVARARLFRDDQSRDEQSVGL
jgi:hypothetical protein